MWNRGKVECCGDGKEGWLEEEREGGGKKKRGMERIGVGSSEKVKWLEEKSIGAKRRTLVVVVGLKLGGPTRRRRGRRRDGAAPPS